MVEIEDEIDFYVHKSPNEVHDWGRGLTSIPEFRLTLQPWKINPYKPISWLEMLQFSAQRFFWSGRALRMIRADCLIASVPGDGDQPVFAVSNKLDDKAKNKALEALKHVEGEFRAIDLRITADTVQEVMDDLENTSVRRNFQWLIEKIDTVEKLAEKELKERVFFYSPPERSKFFPTKESPFAFGKSTSGSFPSALYDIHESAMCLALARPSACVFHLMRTLEIGLSALGDKFGVSLLHTNWAPAIEQIESKIRDMHKDTTWKALPNYKDLQEQYAQAASTFGIFKDAWRNYTMHLRGKYTEGEAELIFNNVKAFMQKITDMGLKEPV